MWPAKRQHLNIVLIAGLTIFLYLLFGCPFWPYRELDSFERLFIERKKNASIFCSDREIPRLDIWRRNLYYYDNLKLIWCPVYKGASRTWRQFLFQIDPGLSWEKKDEIYERTEGRWIRITGETAKPLTAVQFQRDIKLHDEKSFLVVRHPFERIVSAFRDKWEVSKSE